MCTDITTKPTGICPLRRSLLTRAGCCLCWLSCAKQPTTPSSSQVCVTHICMSLIYACYSYMHATHICTTNSPSVTLIYALLLSYRHREGVYGRTTQRGDRVRVRYYYSSIYVYIHISMWHLSNPY
jgi:hypothetical protein